MVGWGAGAFSGAELQFGRMESPGDGGEEAANM